MSHLNFLATRHAGSALLKIDNSLPVTFNARAETVAEKPMFRDAFRRARCLIPASGYYEWETAPDGKQPHYITSADRPILTIAGLWSEWHDRLNDETLTTCTMIITEANSFISAIHDRMPVLLEEKGRRGGVAIRGGRDRVAEVGARRYAAHVAGIEAREQAGKRR